MYAWIFRHLPGPVWLKIIESLAIVSGIVYLLMTRVYPWVQVYFELGGSEVG